jgi:hypothetical protein
VPHQKTEIITFKAETDLVDALKRLPNRSEFIRRALLTALDNICPVCQGTGNLTPMQKTHLSEFLEHHSLRRCGECNEVHLVCESRA